jgi:hypothetical protein
MRIAKFALTIVFAVAGLVLLANQRVAAKEGIPLEALAGNYAFTCQGTFALCLNPGTFGVADCATTTSPIIVPLTDLGIGQVTRDTKGNSCSSDLDVTSSLPVAKTPPSVGSVHPAVAKTLNYDPATGTGDLSFVEYSGGNCNGSAFDSTGSTETGTLAAHFAASDRGKRFDLVFTSLIIFPSDTTGNFVGGFSLSCTSLRQ